jgi:hypothetical protein
LVENSAELCLQQGAPMDRPWIEGGVQERVALYTDGFPLASKPLSPKFVEDIDQSRPPGLPTKIFSRADTSERIRTFLREANFRSAD